MTISSNNRIIRYTGTGTSIFTFQFKVFQASDIQVIKQTISNGVETVLALTSEYSVTLNNDQNYNPGGSITTVIPVTSSYYLTITSAMDNFQPTDLSNQGGFYPDVINDSFDRACIQIQQLHTDTQRAITYPISDGVTTNLEIPSVVTRANKYFVFDGSGNPSVAAVPVGGISTSLALTDTTASTNSATGTLTVAGGAGIAKDSYINGVFVGTRGLTSVTAVGANSMLSATGTSSTAFGINSMSGNTAALCTGIGSSSLSSNTGASSTAVGNNSLSGNTGASCTAVGASAGFTNTGGALTAIGLQAAYQNIGNSVTAVGYNALYTNTQSSCTAVGVDALNANAAGQSVGIGTSAGKTNTGTNLVAIGHQAGFSNTGANSVVIGVNSGYTNTGLYLTAVGYYSGYFNQGLSNTAVGFNALSLATGCTGSSNTSLGEGTMAINSSGGSNTGLGRQSLYVTTTGSSNVAVGASAGAVLTTGSNNVFIGAGTSAGAAAHTNSIVIGQGVAGIGSNTTVIGKAATLVARIFGLQSTGQAAPTIASALSISPTTSIVFISGTAAISTIIAPATFQDTGGQITLIPLGAFTTLTSVNIALASTAVVGRAMIMTWDNATFKWYPSY